MYKYDEKFKIECNTITILDSTTGTNNIVASNFKSNYGKKYPKLSNFPYNEKTKVPKSVKQKKPKPKEQPCARQNGQRKEALQALSEKGHTT